MPYTNVMASFEFYTVDEESGSKTLQIVNRQRVHFIEDVEKLAGINSSIVKTGTGVPDNYTIITGIVQLCDKRLFDKIVDARKAVTVDIHGKKYNIEKTKPYTITTGNRGGELYLSEGGYQSS